MLRQELRRASRAGAVADWLHNLAMYAADDFEGFREDWFWQHYERMVERHGDRWDYRGLFDRHLEELDHPAGAEYPAVGAGRNGLYFMCGQRRACIAAAAERRFVLSATCQRIRSS